MVNSFYYIVASFPGFHYEFTNHLVGKGYIPTRFHYEFTKHFLRKKTNNYLITISNYPTLLREKKKTKNAQGTIDWSDDSTHATGRNDCSPRSGPRVRPQYWSVETGQPAP